MTAPLFEVPAIGPALRDAERRGLIETPVELREFAASIPYTPQEVDRAFELLSGWGRGALVEPTEIAGASQRVDALLAEGLVETTDNGTRRLTEKGARMWALLIAYVDPTESWQASGKPSRHRRIEPVAEQRRRMRRHAQSQAGRRRSQTPKGLQRDGLSLRRTAG